jgi:hypothetical protein
MVFNRSGVVRSFPPLGFGWWRTDAYGGGYGGGDRDHVNDLSVLRMAVSVGDTVFLAPPDFERYGIALSSAYHTHHLMSYDWRCGRLSFSLRFFLAGENSICCLVECSNEGDADREVRLDAVQLYRIGDVKWWGSDGITARYLPEIGVSVSKVWAYGDVFALGASVPPIAHGVTEDEKAWEKWARSGEIATLPGMSVMGRGPLWTAHAYRLSIPAHGRTGRLVCLSRGKNERAALEELRDALLNGIPGARTKLAEDESFWSYCPVLEGDWSASWKRGWVYDFETLRMTVRPPLGVFHHPWDGMQVHSPRAVLGETSLDMLTLAYGDPALAREVIEGTFADALAPNIPCMREDGSMNMISSDGSECGTAPMWGFPFHVIASLFDGSADSAWIASLYPSLREYLFWWLRNRTDSEGWLHCNNSWESGQDGSRRFLVAERNEGAVADFVRTVDVEASMAEALQTMERFARVVGRSEDGPM